ncbi:MAG TPA: hypothetical protein VF116_16045 [Ktedonobacterales bacterium]
MANDTVQVSQGELARLLGEAERAHGEYEATLGHRDEDWPAWYAAYIVGKLKGAAASPASPQHRGQKRHTGTSQS